MHRNRLTRSLGAIALALFMAPTLASAGQRYAVVIGIDNYEAMGKLTTCRNDARAVRDVLVERAGFDPDFVMLMTDDATEAKDRPTLMRMKRSIRQVAELAQSGDAVLVFFSGHGVTVVHDGKGAGYLVPLDGDRRSGLPLDWVRSTLGSSKADTKLLVLDACHAGSGVKGVGGIAPSLKLARGLVMLLSCAADQVSYEDDGHSVFTRRLLDGLAGQADADGDRAVTHTELYAYLRRQMARWCMTSRKTQTPLLVGEQDTPLVLARVQRQGTYKPKPGPSPAPTVTRPIARSKVYTKWPFDAAEAKRRQEETARALGVKVEHDFELAGGVKITMVLIPAGEFMMGSPEGEEKRDDDEKLHRVTISKPFWMSKYEVTQEQWQGVMGANPSRFKGAKNPVETVSWNDIQGFLKKVNARVRGATLALPTEAQWEYACRAGTATPFHFGETISTEQANYDGNRTYGNGRKGVYREKTMPVGSFPANAWALHDVHGNVWEWCASPYAEKYDGSQSKGAEADARVRVLRGGGWTRVPSYCRSANRYWLEPAASDRYYGFRVVLLFARTSH